MKVNYRAVITGLVLLTFQGLVVAQTSPSSSQLIKASITIDYETLAQQKPAIATITIENISGREIDLKPIGSLELLSMSREAQARRYPIRGDSYWSPIDISTGTPLKLEIIDPELQKKGVVVGRVPRVSLKFEKDEIKTFNVDLTKTLWNDSILSTWPNESLFEVVPKGSYSLHFRLNNGDSRVRSNEVKVLVQ